MAASHEDSSSHAETKVFQTAKRDVILKHSVVKWIPKLLQLNLDFDPAEFELLTTKELVHDFKTNTLYNAHNKY